MKNDLTAPQEKGAKARRAQSAARQAEARPDSQLIHAERSGDWMAADELRETALAALLQKSDVTLDLDRIDHLDASALQILLALHAELKKHNHDLRLAKASAHLLKWFEFAGAGDRFLMTGQTNDE